MCEFGRTARQHIQRLTDNAGSAALRGQSDGAVDGMDARRRPDEVVKPAGAATRTIASYVVAISDAGREPTEVLSSFFATAVLVSVGLWMRQKSIGGRWQAYLKQNMTSALHRRSAWFLFSVASLSVYREVFETVVFVAALTNDGQPGWLLGGIAAGSLALAGVAWVLMRTTLRLPPATFFIASSSPIAVLALMLTGKGIDALHKASWVAMTPVPSPQIDLLGIYPT